MKIGKFRSLFSFCLTISQDIYLNIKMVIRKKTDRISTGRSWLSFHAKAVRLEVVVFIHIRHLKHDQWLLISPEGLPISLVFH